MWVPEEALSEEEIKRPFFSAGFPKKEYTNSIVASRDTNISPLEVYDTLQTRLRQNNSAKDARALDVGAGAGVSTQVFYQQLGFSNIDAVDWSGEAWQLNVVEGGYCPPTVNFYELDDERFVVEWKKNGLPKYDIIAFNFAVNRKKALYFCQNLLKPDGLLLAPINTQNDYWLKQTYQLLDAEGRAVWSANDVGAWSVQFQPDVTQDTCQGIWCSPYNGFQKLRTYN
jgi:2-polyprenyl-3-methyl-5-hydroxy-6-metoxy-1,4-benzoquinol methylase